MYCYICNLNTKYSEYTFNRHLKLHNISNKNYYDKYLLKNKENCCSTCGKPTKFISIIQGYKVYCSHKCSANNIKTKKLKEQTSIKNYGVSNPSKDKNVMGKSIKTRIEKYGTANNAEKIKETCLKKYGVKNYTQTIEYRKFKENKNEWLKLNEYSDWKKYFLLVWQETNKHRKFLFNNWNGLDYYDNKKLIINEKWLKINPTLHYSNNKLQPTIDHKISILYGLKNNIDPKKIGNIDNLCITSRQNNCKKSFRNAN